jgi:hypothetical protein
MYNKIDIVKYLIEEFCMNRNKEIYRGTHLLGCAIIYKNIDIVKYLIGKFGLN